MELKNASGTPEDKKYIVALLIALGGILVFIFLLALIAVQVLRPAVRRWLAANEPRTAGTALVVPRALSGDFSISTVVDVTLPQGVHSEPSLQFNAYDPVARETWEAGIIRARTYGYRPASYVSDASPTHRYRITYLPAIADGPHRMELSRSGTTLKFSVDGRTVYTFASEPVSRTASLQLTIATSIGRFGEQASGSLWDVRIVKHASNIESLLPRCSVSWGGVALVPKGARWVLEGQSDPGRLAQRVRNCLPATASD